MRDPRCWREVFLRGGMTMIMAVVAWLFLDVAAWVLLLPLAIAAVTCLKWSLRPQELDDDDDDSDDVDSINLSDLL